MQSYSSFPHCISHSSILLIGHFQLELFAWRRKLRTKYFRRSDARTFKLRIHSHAMGSKTYRNRLSTCKLFDNQWHSNPGLKICLKINNKWSLYYSDALKRVIWDLIVVIWSTYNQNFTTYYLKTLGDILCIRSFAGQDSRGHSLIMDEKSFFFFYAWTAKIQISLCIIAIWSEPSLSAFVFYRHKSFHRYGSYTQAGLYRLSRKIPN